MKQPWAFVILAACGGGGSATDNSDDSVAVDAAVTNDATSSDATPSGCTLAANTTASGRTSPSGCEILVRDTSACMPSRTAAGLTGVWLKFSCRVTLGSTGTAITAAADGQPDFPSNYFAASNICHEAYTGAIQNPNTIAAHAYTLSIPKTPVNQPRDMMGAVVGMTLNGVPIFGNFAAPGDDIYTEAKTFDRCGGHPQNSGVYHNHSEPMSISYDDDNLIGVLLDGYPLYGRKDADGTYPTLDSFGGHTGTTPDSTTATYHYHVNQQTSTAAGTAGQQQWFLTTGTYRGAPGTCSGC